MMISCNYEINIAKEKHVSSKLNYYAHYVRQELGDIYPEEAIEIYEDTKKRYPKEKGFKVSLHQINCTGKTIKED